MYVRALDAVGNATSTSFTFVRDQTPPALSLSAVPNNFGTTTAKSVSVTVAGTLSDATEIRRVFLSIHKGAECTATSDPLPGSQVSGPVRRLDNETNKIEFSEVFTVKQGADADVTPYCFFLKAEDDARDADDRATANVFSAKLSTFNVGWPAGPPAPPPGPTFEFMNVDGTEIDGPLEVTEGDATGVQYAVSLANVATAPTAASPLAVTLSRSPGVIVAPASLSFPNTNVTGADTLIVTVTTAHDLDIMSNAGSVGHSATDYDAASLAVQSNDDDFAISVDTESIREDDAATEVTVTVTAGTAPSADTDVTVTLGYPDGDAETTPAAATEVTVTIEADDMSGEAKVNVDAIDDTARDEVNDMISLTQSASDQGGVYYVPASIKIEDDDPDVMLSLSMDEVDEDAGTVTVRITATADAPVNGITTFTLALTGTATGGGTDYADPAAGVAVADDQHRCHDGDDGRNAGDRGRRHRRSQRDDHLR